MTTHRWKWIGKTQYATIYVDYNQKKTKIEGYKYIYYHNGIYPYHNPDYTKRTKR